MKPHDSLRGQFAYDLHEHMRDDEDIYVITGDLGYLMFDGVRKSYPDRFFNVGAAEQLMLDMAVGMALSGKKPFAYSITPFLLYRPFETLRTYIAHERIPVRMVGSGVGRDYTHDGISHWADDAPNILQQLPNLKVFIPETKRGVTQVVARMVTTPEPQILLLHR